MATPVPGRLTVGSDGRLRGPARIEYNDPWPCVNGSWGSGAVQGVLQHTMVGDLPGTVAVFNQPGFDASAHFGVDQAGLIHQFGPIGKGWVAWHAMAANLTWYGIEFADNGNPDNPLTPAQVTAAAQLVECLSAFAGFPLAEANSPSEHGFGVHYMGGAAWGGHTCPDEPPAHVRSSQRPAILVLAAQIRAGAPASAVSKENAVQLTGEDNTIHVPKGAATMYLGCSAPQGAPCAVTVMFGGQGAAAKTYSLSWGTGEQEIPVTHWPARVVLPSGWDSAQYPVEVDFE